MTAQFKQKLIAQGWRFKRFAKGSHQLWSHPERGIVSISVNAARGQISKAIEAKLFGF
ncbi:MAG: hypothetical protein J0L70_23755 [Leptolyngbya sp. UWPOB_LEPTO1]|uniref:hypothetical protein n=1 Tax=Leptolyngbya sp. UWPOB_LEPTO1 TaxID=2815653 RepID=UPI001ACF2353|nr:hypothetical protein [Leptolyngbya sp. UWPOB_LEPTO1]MBN8563559.1 hypothetical protein [Leptolyngbya sp. UWPOB_LEPTO1]